MAGPRLLFLWPMLARTVEAPATRTARAKARMQAFHSSTPRRQQQTIAQRYGSANEPPPHLGGGKGLGPKTPQDAPASPQKALPKIGEGLQEEGEVEVEAVKDAQVGEEVASSKEAAARTEPTTVDGAGTFRADPMLDSGESSVADDPTPTLGALGDNPMKSVLASVPDPIQHEKQEQSDKQPATDEQATATTIDEHAPPIKAPHISAPRHVHHFDTYGLVKRLADSGWSEAQSITTMKAVRLMLADNMELAREALVSKSNVENETYLFRAACAELRTEVMARRRAEQEKMRTERTQLQHEVDILNQRMGQESLNLKDELKGMFDDRKLAVRAEQSNMESKVQQLNYKITVSLQADARSDVEGLRWVMTRRVIITLALVVVMVIGSLRLYSNALHEQELEAKRRAKMKSGGTQTDDEGGFGGDYDGGRRDVRSLGGGEMLVKEGDNPAFVSLG